MRLINADALMGQLEKKRSEPGNQRYTEGFNDALMRFRSMIHSASTIEAEPVRHGTWEEIETYAFVGFDGNGSLKERRQKYYRHICGRCSAIKEKFCPNCGAIMDGGVSNVQVD